MRIRNHFFFLNCLFLTSSFNFQFLQPKLLRTSILFATPTFLYFNSKEKYTILKPKFKNFFPNFGFSLGDRKEVLLVSVGCVFDFLDFRFLKSTLKAFLPCTTKRKYISSFRFFVGFTFKIFFKVISIEANFYRYFFLRLFRPVISKYQKKINFLQFNVFFKNTTILSVLQNSYQTYASAR